MGQRDQARSSLEVEPFLHGFDTSTPAFDASRRWGTPNEVDFGLLRALADAPMIVQNSAHRVGW
jgi:hypothetical protein